MTATHFVLAALLVFTAVAAYVDFRTGHIPNRLIVVGLAGGLLLHTAFALSAPSVSGAGLARQLGSAALGLVCCALVPLILFRLGAMGGGDVKLLAALGAMAGARLGLEIELTAFVLVTLYAPARLAYEGRLLQLLGNSAALLVNPLLPKARRRAVPAELLTSLRFGPAVFAATLVLGLGQLWGAR